MATKAAAAIPSSTLPTVVSPTSRRAAETIPVAMTRAKLPGDTDRIARQNGLTAASEFPRIELPQTHCKLAIYDISLI
jgi:hypothetical protein